MAVYNPPSLQQVTNVGSTSSSNLDLSGANIQSGGSFRYNNNIKETFGTSIVWSNYSDGTDFYINRESGSGIVKFGTASDVNIQCGKIGLGTTAISNLFWINFVQTTSTGRGALQFDYVYTGAGPQANILSYPTYQGSAGSPICYAIQTRVRDDSDPAGTGNYVVLDAQFGTPNTRTLTQGTKNFYGMRVNHNQGVGTANSGCTIRQYGAAIFSFNTYTGVTSQTRFGIYSEEPISLFADTKLYFNDTSTAHGTTYAVYNSATTDMDWYHDGTQIWNWDNDTVDCKVDFTLTDAKNVILGTTTGTKFGTSTTQKLAFYNSTPIVQRTGAAQAAAAATAATNVAPYGYTTAAQADAIVTLVNELRAALVALGLIKGSA